MTEHLAPSGTMTAVTTAAVPAQVAVLSYGILLYSSLPVYRCFISKVGKKKKSTPQEKPQRSVQIQQCKIPSPELQDAAAVYIEGVTLYYCCTGRYLGGSCVADEDTSVLDPSKLRR